MSVYTKRGDDGKTDIIGKKRIFKSDKRICAIGAVSQAGSYIEAAIVFLQEELPLIKTDLEIILNMLLNCCHDLALDDDDKKFKISNADIEHLEKCIDNYETKLVSVNQFIRLGLCKSSAFLNIAMTTTRWAER